METKDSLLGTPKKLKEEEWKAIFNWKSKESQPT